MKIQSLFKELPNYSPNGVSTLNRKMVRERAVELALIDGRSSLEVSGKDWDQAKRDLTHQPEIDSEREYHDSLQELEKRNSRLLFRDREIFSEHNDDQSLQSESVNENTFSNELDTPGQKLILQSDSTQRQIDE